MLFHEQSQAVQNEMIARQKAGHEEYIRRARSRADDISILRNIARDADSVELRRLAAVLARLFENL